MERFCPKQITQKTRNLRDEIKSIFWDVDGTLFEKSSQIKKEQRLIIYNAFAICKDPKKDHNPFNVRQNMTFRTLAEVPEEVKNEFDSLLMDKKTNPHGRYGSNGHLFMGEFGKDQCYVAKLISTIDYSRLLSKDMELVKMFDSFRMEFPKVRQGIMSNEVYETIAKLFLVLGLDISQFQNELIDRIFPPNPDLIRDSLIQNSMGILTGYNLKGKKPDEQTFKQILTATDLESEPHRLLYVGDSEIKDIIPANALGITTALVWSNDEKSSATYTLKTVYEVLELFKK